MLSNVTSMMINKLDIVMEDRRVSGGFFSKKIQMQTITALKAMSLYAVTKLNMYELLLNNSTTTINLTTDECIRISIGHRRRAQTG